MAGSADIPYTNLPCLTDAGASRGEDIVNGPSGTLDGVSIVEGHELAESITDPALNAWYDAGGNEIGDKRAWFDRRPRQRDHDGLLDDARSHPAEPIALREIT